jgi:ABC-2 type transport system ATP-binding protein/lipopolysaccharide transport system ATP-binding protein
LASAIISLEGVSLCYRLANYRSPSFKQYAIHWVTGALTYRKMWALSDVSLSIARGESVGIVGRNGAGKTTLLKVISRVLKPTRGRVAVSGRTAPILALGTGFDYELTGRENILLNALLLGHSRREVQERIEAIVEFSGLGEFANSPVRNYSSGMVARLGFSVATAWVPDVLILDEVLTVGDAHFVKECNARLDQFRQAGTTVVLVSHEPDEILRNCTRCLWLDEGKVRADGTPPEILKCYTASVPSRS